MNFEFYSGTVCLFKQNFDCRPLLGDFVRFKGAIYKITKITIDIIDGSQHRFLVAVVKQ